MAPRDLPSGTVTFLFSDIESSTQLWEQHPQDMQSALAQHDAILHEAMVSHGGHVVKTTGDGVHAVFGTAAEAVLAAAAAQRGLATSPTIRVRMGIHTGEAELREGDYYGSAVNRAARLMSIGHGGQVLLSGVSAALVDGALPEGMELRDLGQYRLRGLSRPERILQLVAADLPADFPALNTEEARHGNLPEALTSFIGRERELGQVTALLGENRLVTLTGPGGTGKTRLSLQVGRKVQPEFTHGVWLVELAPLSDPQMVPAAVATLWDLRENSPGSLTQQLTDFLRTKELLLILDNCEHLVSACAELASELLPSAHQLTIMASSREGLGIAGETTYHLPTLGIPSRDDTDLSDIEGYDAVQLFVERARAARPGFELTNQNAKAVGQIVRRLDGIPLAIELAAARIKLLPPEQLAARLDDRFKLLTGGSRTALPRQQTLRALIDWSYDLLDNEERWFLRQLGVFVGGWTLEAAEGMVTGPLEASELSEGKDAFDLIASLVNKSLINMDEETGEARFRFLETIRQYAREKLFETGETVAARNRHLVYFGNVVGDVGAVTAHMEGKMVLAGFGSQTLYNWIEEVLPDVDNLRAALAWALEVDPERALPMALDMTVLTQWVIPQEEALEWLRAAIAQSEPRRAGEDSETYRHNLTLLAAMVMKGNLQLGMGENAASFASLSEAEALARELGDRYDQVLAMALMIKGTAANFINSPEAFDIASEAANLMTKINFPGGRALPLTHMASALLQAGDRAAAVALFDEALVLRDQVDNLFLNGLVSVGLHFLAMALNRPDTAREILYDSQAAYQKLHNPRFAVVIDSELAHLERREGHDDKAETIYLKTIRIWQEFGILASVANQLEALAFIAIHRSQFRRAGNLLGAAEAMRARRGTEMLLHERAEYDREVATLRSSISEVELETAWQHGRTLDMNAAVELALN